MVLPGRFIDAPQTFRSLCLAGIFVACSMGARADESNSTTPLAAPHSASPVHEPVVAKPPLDLSGHKRRRKASFYAPIFSGRTMADGTVMQPHRHDEATK